MADEMFFSRDERSLRRGKRSRPRTDVCRPCLVIVEGQPDWRIEGVVLDVSPYGMLIRTMERLSAGQRVAVQLMRDENFQSPLAAPLEGEIVRIDGESGGFIDYGIKLEIKEIPRPEPPPPAVRTYAPAPRRGSRRMHTIDFTVGGSRDRKPR